MKPVQLILSLILLFIGGMYLGHFRSRVLDRLIVLAFTALGLSMVIAPDWTNAVAHVVGVGRGADLFIYLAILGGVFVLFLFYSKLKELETALTSFVRAVALSGAIDPLSGISYRAPDEAVDRKSSGPIDPT
jgi:hypothetical protein